MKPELLIKEINERLLEIKTNDLARYNLISSSVKECLARNSAKKDYFVLLRAYELVSTLYKDKYGWAHYD